MSDIEYIKDHLDKIATKIDMVHGVTIRLEGNLDNTIRRIDKHEVEIESHKSTINRAYGAIAAMGIFAGGIGASIAKIFNGG